MESISILICSWNSLEQTKLLVSSIQKNSAIEHEINIHVNEVSEEFLDWITDNKIQNYSYSSKNEGLAVGTNTVSQLATSDFIYLVDDDMYLLPKWDIELFNTVKQINDDKFWINSTMIEPIGQAPWTIGNEDYGRTPNDFQEERLLIDYPKFLNTVPDLYSTALPCLLPTKYWKKVGGYDERFGLAIGSEEGLAKRFWDVGCRLFVNSPNSLIYHLQQSTTSKLTNYNKHRQHRETLFQKLYQISCTDFNTNYIKRGQHWQK